MIQPNKWYNKEQTPPVNCKLILTDGIDYDSGYYYNHRFYVENIDVTQEVTKWCLPSAKIPVEELYD